MSRVERSVSYSLTSLASALALLSSYAHAATPETVSSDTVVVTATRTAQTADASMASVQVIRRDEIERAQANDVAELLRFFAGVDIGRNGGPGQATSVFIRGTESNHTLLLIDGVKANTATDGGAAWQNIDPALIDHIEIVRGPRSSLYGSEAIGGVVQIFTRKPSKGVSEGGSFGLGSNNTVRGDARLSGTQGKVRGSMALSFQDTDGFQTLISQTDDRGYNNKTVNVDVGVDLGAVDVAFSTWVTQGKTEYYAGFPPFISLADQDFRNQVTAVTLSSSPVDNWNSQLKLSFNEDRITQNQSSDVADTERWAVDWQNDIQLGETQLLTVGAYAANENVDFEGFGQPFNKDRNIVAMFGQDDIVLGGINVLLAARYTDDEVFGKETTWNTTLGYHFSAASSVYASVGTGYRTPTFVELFSSAGGNPNLNPEESTNYELGAKYQLGAGNKVSVTAFQNEIDDLVAFAQDAGGNFVAENVEKTRTRGVEIEYRYRFGKWSGFLSGTYQNPENRDTGEQLARRAKKSFSAALNYNAGPYQFGGKFLATGKREDFNGPFAPSPLGGYGVLDLNASKKINPNLTVRGRLENVFDKDYQTAGGFKTQGRAVFLNLDFSGKGI